MLSGKVKWFNNAKGYGFILAEGRDEDLFAHYSAIQMDGYKTLKAGQPVNFEIIQGPKGLHAINISRDNRRTLRPRPAGRAAGDAHRSLTPNADAEMKKAGANRPFSRSGASPSYILAIIASPNSEQDSRVAPSIRRSKS